MTIVVAKKFENRICVMSDTMITDKGSARNNIIPGRLKSIVINSWLTISYAGLSTQAIDAIRNINKGKNISTKSSIDYLKQVSLDHFGELDFIICSHESDPKIIKIYNGQVFQGANTYWIGTFNAAREFSKIEIPIAESMSLPDSISLEEMKFKNSFFQFMREHNCDGIGGAIIDCLCSPYGHCYNTHAEAFSWDTICIGNDNPIEREEKNKTGMYHYEYHVYSTSKRGQPIVGFYLNQAKVGFIYDPIHYDEAMKIERLSHSEFASLIEDAGKSLSKIKGE